MKEQVIRPKLNETGGPRLHAPASTARRKSSVEVIDCLLPARLSFLPFALGASDGYTIDRVSKCIRMASRELYAAPTH